MNSSDESNEEEKRDLQATGCIEIIIMNAAEGFKNSASFQDTMMDWVIQSKKIDYLFTGWYL